MQDNTKEAEPQEDPIIEEEVVTPETEEPEVVIGQVVTAPAEVVEPESTNSNILPDGSQRVDYGNSFSTPGYMK